MAVSISVKLHPFPHLISWERTVSLNNIDNPKYHAAIPNGSRMERWGCCLKVRPPPKQKGCDP